MLQGDITFKCGHYHYYPEPTPHSNVCPFVECRPLYSYTYRRYNYMPYPCQQCIRQEVYVYKPERFPATPGEPVHRWVRRDGNDNVVGPDSDPSLRVPREAPETVLEKNRPQRVRILGLLPRPALARTSSGTLAINLRRRLKQEVRKGKCAEQRRAQADSRGEEGHTSREAEGNTQDIKEDIRGDVQAILEEELRDLMEEEAYQEITEEVKREARSNAYNQVYGLLLREMQNMMEETKKIMKENLAVVLERVELKEGVKKEVKEEMKVKDESE